MRRRILQSTAWAMLHFQISCLPRRAFANDILKKGRGAKFPAAEAVELDITSIVARA
jgi:hypothetical protein